MWDVYRRGGSVIAVKSTVGLLKKVVAPFDKPVFIGKVQYIDWNDAQKNINLLVMCVRKELAYRHEDEVRAVIFDRNQVTGATPPVLHLEVPFDPRELIKEVVVGPREKPWIHALVKQVMNRYALPQPVNASNLLQSRI
jgi:hypothetical protein